MVDESSLGVDKTLKILGLSSSRYPRWRRDYELKGFKGLENQRPLLGTVVHKLFLEKKQAILDCAREHPNLRHRALTYCLETKEDVWISESSVYRILKKESLVASRSPKRKAEKECKKKVTRPNEIWHSDICYIPIGKSFWCFIGILDSFSRYIVHWILSWKMDQEEVERVVDEAILKYHLEAEGDEEKPKLVTDSGAQFKAKSFKQFLKELGIKHIKIAYRHPESNGKIERFHETLKYEDVYSSAYEMSSEAKEGIAKFINYHNYERTHQGINNVTPYQKFTGQDVQMLKERQRKREDTRFLRKIANQLQTEIDKAKIEGDKRYLLKNSPIGSEA